MPASTGFRCTPTPTSPRIGGTSWNACSGIPPAVPCPWSAWRKTPTAISSTPSPIPWSDGTTGIRLSPMELLEKLAALVPLPRVHLVRYGGCLAPHSHLRGAIIPTPRQQGVDEEETDTGSPRWDWARLLKRVFALDMARCPFCQQGALRIIAAITQGEVIRKILRHLKLAADPPLIAPARIRQEAFAWSSA